MDQLSLAHLGREVIEIIITCHLKTAGSTASENWGSRLEGCCISESRNGHSSDHSEGVGSHG